MSKAFTKENDTEEFDEDGEERAEGGLPQDKNYITPAGAVRLRTELEHLMSVERPKVCEIVSWAAGNGDRSENADYQYGKKRLREIDKRVAFLTRRIDKFVIVDPAIDRGEKIFFGATVTIEDEDGKERQYAIVGADEVDVAKGRISWISPLGAALLKASVGDWVQFRTPKGLQEVQVVAVRYVPLP